VADSGSLVERPRGAPVFVAGQPAGASFLIVRGAVEVIGRHGAFERRLAVLGPGQLFGFMSMLEGQPHGVSCHARESALLLELTRPRFEALYMGGNPVAPKLHRAVHRSLLGSLAQTNRRLTRLISQLRLSAALGLHAELSAAYHGQLVAGE
jgi:CRP-like cAMP-binding protein